MVKATSFLTLTIKDVASNMIAQSTTNLQITTAQITAGVFTSVTVGVANQMVQETGITYSFSFKN
jgi:hypothetical protein